ncbi:hypothetical protein GGI22_003000, partial [Coemansia erecta]
MADSQTTVAPVDGLPFELLLAICQRLRCCSCATPGTQAFALGCSGNHPPGAFGSTELSVLRQTTRKWRSAALRQGLTQLVVSNRWMRNSTHDRLRDISRNYASFVRKVVFRSSDYYQGGPRRSTSGSPADEFDAILAMGWPCIDSVSVEMFSVRYSEHETIVNAVRRYSPRVKELYIRDKLASLTQITPLLWGPSGPVSGGRCASIRRLAIKPYGYNQHWSALVPSERGAAEMLSVDRSDTVLPIVSRMFPNLCALSVRHVWQRTGTRPINVVADSARGALMLQNAQWLDVFLENKWPNLRSLTLPAIADMDAERLPAACPNLIQLVTNSLDYS